MTKKPQIDLPPPSQEEEDRINAGIAADPDTSVLDAEWFEGARPYREEHPEVMYGVKPKIAPEIIERLAGTEPETARRLAAYNHEIDEAKRKNWTEFAAAHPERARELEEFDRQAEERKRADKRAVRASAPKIKAG